LKRAIFWVCSLQLEEGRRKKMKTKYKKYFYYFSQKHPVLGNVLEKTSSIEGLKSLISIAQNRIDELGGGEASTLFEESNEKKNVDKRFKDYTNSLKNIISTRPQILNGDTFEERVDSYEMLVAHLKNTWIRSKKLYLDGDYALSVFLSILVIEETAKMNFAWQDLYKTDNNNNIKLNVFFNNHKNKLFIGIMSACLINARLDRILGIEFIEEMLKLSEEKNGFMKLRNSSVYIDYVNGKIVIPNEKIDKELSKKLCVLSGEIMAETVGFFVWDWEDLLKEVNDFEIEVGMHNESFE
jgi:AbiV family abortive infection protein